MNDINEPAMCLVCETTANGQHFGIKCCRACAAFFRRTLTMNLRYKCRFEKKCKVSLNMRYSCRHCRFQKCLAVGMRRDMVQTRPEDRKDSDRDSECYSASPHDDELYDYNPQGFISEPSTSFLAEDEVKPSMDFHESVIQELGRAVLPGQQSKHPHLRVNDKSNENKKTVLTMAAHQAAQDLHSNVQTILKPYIDSLFEKDSPIIEHLSSIPLTMCQQALLAYNEHNKMWPVDENAVIDMDVMMRNHYIEITNIARFCMSISTFAELPKDQKWIIFKHFWSKFCELDRCFVTCRCLGYNPDDDRSVTLTGEAINFSVNVVKLEVITDMDVKQLEEFLKSSFEKMRDIFINPFKKLRPTDFELMYMMMNIMWNVGSLPGITTTTTEIAERAEQRLAEELHIYYSKLYEHMNPNYAGRITKLSSIASAVDEITERKKEDSQISKTFNIFKTDVFFAELSDFPV